MTRARQAVQALLIAAPLLMSACAVGPNYHRPPLPPSAGYGVAATATEPGAPALSVGMDVSSEWWRAFHSEALNALVARALANNPTIDAAKSALRAAREQVKAQRAAFLPSVSASFQPSRARYAPELASPLQSGSDLYNLTTTQVSISYTPDLFGANARAVESLKAQADQQRFELEAARLSLATNVVEAAIQDALLRAQIAATQAIIADQQQTYASFERQYALGAASKADLAAQAALLAQARASLPALEKQFQINRDLLAALVGRTPSQPLDVQFAFEGLALPDPLPLSLPAQIVDHRPDVRMAEAQLHAASAEVGVAAAARWPSIEIAADAGSAAIGLTPVFNNESNFWSIAGTLTAPLFDGGALRHRERSAKALYDQAASQYQSTVIGAFQNTADVLNALASDATALKAADDAKAASATSLEIAKQQFGLGDLSRLAMVSAEQADVQAELSQLQARANRYDDVVALFQALGGGWWNRPDPPGGDARKASSSR